MKKIIIVNARYHSGGTLVLSLLCKLLQENGIDAKTLFVHKLPKQEYNFILYWFEWFYFTLKYKIKEIIYIIFKNTKFVNNDKFYPYINKPIEGIKEKLTPFINKKETIVIYPEVVTGNILNAKYVIRYLLYHYKYKNVPKAYEKTDLFICYRQLFNDWDLNPLGYELTLNHFNSNLYRQYNFNEREGKCYLIRKGKDRSDLPKKFDGPVIDFGMKDKEIVDIFNNYKFCYSYDTQTFYNSIAAVCGCIPIVVTEPGKSKKDYLGDNEKNTPGIAYSNEKEEIEYAIRSRKELLENLDFEPTNNENIIKFINLLSSIF